ncbi:hypothetical protein [Caballeronia calidae]|uniref:hypothetical protein n=1 Tax=Caballeronia calidae TaxID=1777139 RepID=UPI0012FDF7B4|nr:hypothetical protein [Caballeronia calidae]
MKSPLKNPPRYADPKGFALMREALSDDDHRVITAMRLRSATQLGDWHRADAPRCAKVRAQSFMKAAYVALPAIKMRRKSLVHEP